MTISASACELFRRDCAAVWDSLRRHPFIRELAAGTLPPEKFRFFLEQNLMYLPEYARVMAVGAATSEDVSLTRYYSAALAHVVETEIPENEELLDRVLALGAADRGGRAPMAPANLAYTSFLLATAFRYGPAEIMAAITPCTWSYGDIAASLGESSDHPLYAEWIAFYTSPAYTGPMLEMNDRLNALAADAGEAMLGRLSDLFRTSVRLEWGFWQMAYRCEQWPDLTP